MLGRIALAAVTLAASATWPGDDLRNGLAVAPHAAVMLRLSPR